MKKIKEEDRTSIPIPTRWNNKEYEDLQEIQKILGEEKVSTAIKRAVKICKNVLLNTFGENITIKIQRRKKQFK